MSQVTSSEQLFITEAEAARRYGLSPLTLKDWRLKGANGPAFHRFSCGGSRGRIMYAIADLDAWAAERRKAG